MTGTLDTPHLSIVVTTRNDNHGGNIMARSQAFADSLQLAARVASFTAELIVVDWNPPPGAAPLADAVRWPSGENIRTRIITVPHNLHARLRAADRLPLFQMIAKNVGIRRARGRYILATNVDVIIPGDLYSLLAPGCLDENSVYRVNRVDVAADPVLGEPDPAKRSEACEQNVVAIHARVTNFVSPQPVTLAMAEAALPKWSRRNLAARGRLVARLALHPRRNRADLWFNWRQWLEELSPDGWHNNASGDFTVMYRDAWSKIEGYWEFEGYSMQIDTLAIYAARAAGMHQVVLPAPLFHVEHGGGWNVAGDRDGTFDASVAAKELPHLEKDIGMILLHGAIKSGARLYENGSAWGMRDEALEESRA